ncbi:MAG: hypothetical protein Q8N34_03330 [Gammaproteobacteria bacterium]|nr:hypothetical protein [Gammaproteobacteria bacterium]
MKMSEEGAGKRSLTCPVNTFDGDQLTPDGQGGKRLVLLHCGLQRELELIRAEEW